MESWPPPPPFYRLYGDNTQIEGVQYVPPAPPPPISGDYELFGMRYSTQVAVPTLAESGVAQLTDGDCNGDLQKLARSVLVTYLEMVKGAAQGENQEARLGAIEVMYVNMHFLVNQHRPQQAHDMVLNMMREELKRRDELLGQIETACQEAERILDGEPANKKTKSSETH